MKCQYYISRTTKKTILLTFKLKFFNTVVCCIGFWCESAAAPVTCWNSCELKHRIIFLPVALQRGCLRYFWSTWLNKMQSHFCTLCNSSWFYSLLFFWFIVKMLNGRVAFKEHFIKCRNISTLVSVRNSSKRLFSISNKKISEISSLDFWARRPIKYSWLDFFFLKGKAAKMKYTKSQCKKSWRNKAEGSTQSSALSNIAMLTE